VTHEEEDNKSDSYNYMSHWTVAPGKMCTVKIV
jgi:hypothetical protein